MPNSYFQFKQFRIDQGQCGMKVTTDGCFMGAVLPIRDAANVLDIGTGTGLLSLMLAQRANISIDAIEIDEQAFHQAKHNFSASPWADRLQISHSALQDFLPKKQYDIILCNPPFFKASQQGKQQHKNKALHAIHLSMDDLAINVKRLLHEQGKFWVMYPEQEMTYFIKIADSLGLYPSSQVILRNKCEGPVFRSIIEFKPVKSTMNDTKEVAIRSQTGAYSENFINYLNEYYLHLT